MFLLCASNIWSQSAGPQKHHITTCEGLPMPTIKLYSKHQKEFARKNCSVNKELAGCLHLEDSGHWLRVSMDICDE